MQLKWTELADADLENVERYITKENNNAVAIDVVLKIIYTTESILLEHPAAGRTGSVKGTRELVIDSVPFIVVYRKIERLARLEVLRVLHDAQQWPRTP